MEMGPMAHWFSGSAVLVSCYDFVIFFASAAGLCYNMALLPGASCPNCFARQIEIRAVHLPDRHIRCFCALWDGSLLFIVLGL